MIKKTFLSTLFFVLGGVAFAQLNDEVKDSIAALPEVENLEEVVLIDSRFPFKQSQSGRPIIKVNTEEISNFQGLGISALIKQYAGIEILGSQTYSGQNKTVSIRGGRNRQVLILIDGIRVSDPSRIENDFNINFLDLSQIESIEILKGAASSLYGSAAATGVINIKTKKASPGFSASLQSSAGSQNSQEEKRGFNLFTNSLHLSKRGEKWGAKTYLSHNRATGMSAVIGSEKDPFDLLNFGASLDYKPKESFDLTTGFDHSSIHSDFDNSFPLEDADFKLITDMSRLYFNPNFTYPNGGLSLRLGYQVVDRDFQSAFPFKTHAENTQLELFNKYVISERYYTVFGLLSQDNFADYEDGLRTNQTDFYGNVVTRFSEGFRLNMGGRWNIHSSYGNHFTYSINPSLELLNKDQNLLKLQTAYSAAFIAPSLYQLYDPYSGNSELQPEENSSFEAGLLYNTKGWEFSTTYFNRLEAPSIRYDLQTYRYENTAEEALFFGAEVILKGEIGQHWSVDHQMTFTDSREGDLRYLPKFSSTTFISFSPSSRWKTTFNTQLVGKRLGLDNTTLLEGYQLVNFSLFYKPVEFPIHFFIQGTNLFNSNYIEIEGYATRGRNFVAGFTYRLP